MGRYETDLFDVNPERVAELIDEAGSSERVWSESELASVLAHQLEAPVQFNLSRMDDTLAAQLRGVAEAEGLLLNSFGELLRHRSPPVELLVLTKDFAKRCRLGSGSKLPKDVAAVLYYAAIAVALVRCNRRISELSDAELCRGLRWTLAKPWLDDQMRDMLEEAWHFLNGSESSAP